MIQWGRGDIFLISGMESCTGQELTAQLWKRMIRSGANALELKKTEIDSLNVFPVPDGDTGTNMYLTMYLAARDTDHSQAASLSEASAITSLGSLMGARGNSGVILSQLFRGIAKGFEKAETADALLVAQALQSGVDTAYKAVMKPVEGTILTVSRETARGTLNSAKSGGSLLEALKEGYTYGQAALERTPELLPVLKLAGVVDAGGQGFLVMLGGWIALLEGKEIGTTTNEVIPKILSSELSTVGQEWSIKDLDYPYCTEFLLKGQNIEIEQIKHDLLEKGDCLLVVGTPEITKIHIHVANPGAILDYALRWGALHKVQIHNMLAQNELMSHSLKSEEAVRTDSIDEAPSKFLGDSETARILKKNGVVAVSLGQGITEIFRGLGVGEIVLGGQTMNPSTEELSVAVEKICAENVYILPNNSNIVLAARQVKEIIKDRQVYIIPTKSIPQGISALLSYVQEGDAEENVRNMEKSLQNVSTGEVTYAVRDSQYGENNISKGDILGLMDGSIVINGTDLLTVAQTTLEKLAWRQKELVTILYGEEVKDSEAEVLKQWLLTQNPTIEVQVYSGGQPLYYYIFGVE